MSYAAYLLTTIGLPRDHHSLFIQTSPSGSGFIYQVSGNIQTGMLFNHKPSSPPSDEADYISMTQIGRVRVQEFENGRLKQVVESVEEPKKQFDGTRRLFPQEPLRRCQEWTAEVIARLGKEGVLLEESHGFQSLHN